MVHVSTECLHSKYHKQDAKGNDVLKKELTTRYDILPELHTVLHHILTNKGKNKLMFNSTVFSYDIV